jgi:two-component system phosphate regulon response regulator PhoB
MSGRMLATDSNKQILIVDRDVASIEPLRQRLGETGFVVRAISDVSAAIVAVADRPPHLVIIDWNMPGLAALQVIQGVRKARLPQGVRLIILSTMSDEQDVVTGLNLGADDYIAKPFSLREVVARVGAVLRCHQREGRGAELSCDDLVLDGSTNRVSAQGSTLMCKDCAKSSPNRATRPISKPFVGSVTGSRRRFPPGPNEAWVSFLQFHAMFHA